MKWVYAVSEETLVRLVLAAIGVSLAALGLAGYCLSAHAGVPFVG